MKKLLPIVVPPSIIILATVLQYLSLNNGHDWGGDFAAYIMQATSVYSGSMMEFIEANHAMHSSSNFAMGPLAYPWGYPVLLVPIVAFFGTDIVALKAVGFVSYLVFMALLWGGFRRYHSTWGLAALMLIFALHPFMAVYSNQILSDVPYMLISTICVLMIGRLYVNRQQIFGPVIDGILLGLLIAGAYAIRTNGVLILATLVIVQLVQFLLSRRRPVSSESGGHPGDGLTGAGVATNAPLDRKVRLIPYITFFVSIGIWNQIFPSGGSGHISNLSVVTIWTLEYNFYYYVELLAEFFDELPFHVYIYWTTVAVCLVGMVLRYRDDYHIIFYGILTYGLYVIWPDLQGMRFMFPLLPFFFSFAISGIEAMSASGSNSGSRPRTLLLTLPLLMLITAFGAQTLANVSLNLERDRESLSGPFTVESDEMFEYIVHSTEPDDVVIFHRPRVMRLMTGRKSVVITGTEELYHGDYICLFIDGWKAYSQLSPGLSLFESADPVFKNREFRIYRVRDILQQGPGLSTGN